MVSCAVEVSSGNHGSTAVATVDLALQLQARARIENWPGLGEVENWTGLAEVGAVELARIGHQQV